MKAVKKPSKIRTIIQISQKNYKNKRRDSMNSLRGHTHWNMKLKKPVGGWRDMGMRFILYGFRLM
jgi:hypothetical protein